MQIIYFGLFSKVFNWVYDKILGPIVEFLTDLLSTALTWLFENVLGPLLENVFWPIFDEVLVYILDLFFISVYTRLTALFHILDAIEEAFEVFSGIQDVTMTSIDSVTGARTTISGSFLEVLIRTEQVQTALWAFVVIGAVLALGFSILATVQSMGDLSRQARPVSRVLSSTMKSLLYLVMIPTVTMFAVVMSSVMLQQINTALAGAEDSTLAGAVFVAASLDAAYDDTYNVSYEGDDAVANIGINDDLRSLYYTRDTYHSYTNVLHVMLDFHLSQIDYFLFIVSGVFLVVVLCIAMFHFVRRIFEVIILMIAAPLFVSVMPLDDGEKLKAWREMFVGKLFGGYGTVIGMQLYLIIVPFVMGGSLSFGDSSIVGDFLIRFFFMLAGAWAVLKVGPVLTQIISAQAGQHEASAQQALQGSAMMVYNYGKRAGQTVKGNIQQARARNAQQQQESAGKMQGKAFGGQAPKAAIGGRPGMIGGRPGMARPGGAIGGAAGGAAPGKAHYNKALPWEHGTAAAFAGSYAGKPEAQKALMGDEKFKAALADTAHPDHKAAMEMKSKIQREQQLAKPLPWQKNTDAAYGRSYAGNRQAQNNLRKDPEFKKALADSEHPDHKAAMHMQEVMYVEQHQGLRATYQSASSPERGFQYSRYTAMHSKEFEAAMHNQDFRDAFTDDQHPGHRAADGYVQELCIKGQVAEHMQQCPLTRPEAREQVRSGLEHELSARYGVRVGTWDAYEKTIVHTAPTRKPPAPPPKKAHTPPDRKPPPPPPPKPPSDGNKG